MATKRVYTPLEVLGMPTAEAKKILNRYDEEIDKTKRRLLELEVGRKVFLEVSSGKGLTDEDDDSLPIIDTSKGDKSDRFVGMPYYEAIEMVLKEAMPEELHVKKIALLLIKNGYGDHRKTSDDIYASVSAALSTGVQQGRPFKKGRTRGYWIFDPTKKNN